MEDVPKAQIRFCSETRPANSGIVGIALSGDIVVNTVVAHGCQSIGERMRITDCDGNVLKSVDDQNPLKVLERLATTLSDHDRELMASSLFLGIGMDPLLGERELKHGGFLIRHLIGEDHISGVLIVGEQVRVGRLCSFNCGIRRRRLSISRLRFRNALMRWNFLHPKAHFSFPVWVVVSTFTAYRTTTAVFFAGKRARLHWVDSFAMGK